MPLYEGLDKELSLFLKKVNLIFHPLCSAGCGLKLCHRGWGMMTLSCGSRLEKLMEDRKLAPFYKLAGNSCLVVYFLSGRSCSIYNH